MGQAVKKALIDPAAEEKLGIVATASREDKKLCAVRCGDIPDLLHTADSRYGRITLATLQVFANRFIHRRLPSAQSASQGFDRDINSDLVPVLEAVSQGLSRAIHAGFDALDEMSFDSFDERAPREPYHPESWVSDRWLVCLEVDCYPSLMRILCRQAMESKRGVEANYVTRDKFGSNSKTMVLRD